MKTIILLFLMVVASASCHTTPDANGQSEEGTRDADTPPEYSRVNQEVYKAFASPQHQTGSRKSPPPIPKLPPLPSRPVTQTVSNKPSSSNAQKTKKPDDNEGRLPSRTQSYSDPQERDDIDPCINDYNDPLPAPVDNQQREYSVTPIPQRDVYGQFARQPAFNPDAPLYRALVRALSSGLRSPVFRRPSYAGILNRVPPVYRSVEYAPPLAYSVPTARRVVYRPAPLRYVQQPSLPYEGIGGADYDNIVSLDYAEVKK